jgi:hypothetical protein
MTVVASILWQRLDAPGHDACRLEQTQEGWRLDGVAVFSEDAQPVRLAYQIACDRTWSTTRGSVIGWIGARPIDISIERSGTAWAMNGSPVPDVDGCLDLDFGFTPATNLFQLRRLALQIGASALEPVAWLDVGAGSLDVLRQRYERRSEHTYWYEARRFDYEALLEVAPAGFVIDYPGLWNKVDIG